MSSTEGRPAKDARLVIGAVIIKHKLCLIDEETVSQTAKKLGVRTYEYIQDRVSGEFKMTSLADLILEKSQPSCDD